MSANPVKDKEKQMYIVGEIKTIIGIDIPECFMECDGQVLEKEEYPELFAKIGYSYGGRNSKFHLPRQSDVVPIRNRGPKNLNFRPKTIICVMAMES